MLGLSYSGEIEGIQQDVCTGSSSTLLNSAEMILSQTWTYILRPIGVAPRSVSNLSHV